MKIDSQTTQILESIREQAKNQSLWKYVKTNQRAIGLPPIGMWKEEFRKNVMHRQRELFASDTFAGSIIQGYAQHSPASRTLSTWLRVVGTVCGQAAIVDTLLRFGYGQDTQLGNIGDSAPVLTKSVEVGGPVSKGNGVPDDMADPPEDNPKPKFKKRKSDA